MSKIDGICQKSKVIFDICRKFLYIFDIFDHFPVYIAKLEKNDQNLTPNCKNYTKIFGIFDCRQIFGLSTLTENVPKYSTFDCQLSQNNFAKLYRTSEILPLRMALVLRLFLDSIGLYAKGKVEKPYLTWI